MKPPKTLNVETKKFYHILFSTFNINGQTGSETYSPLPLQHLIFWLQFFVFVFGQSKTDLVYDIYSGILQSIENITILW